jgi:hypothetical protein
MARTYRVAVIAATASGAKSCGKASTRWRRQRGATACAGWREFDWSCETYLTTGRMMPEEAGSTTAAHMPCFSVQSATGVPDHVSLWGLLIPAASFSAVHQSTAGAALAGVVSAEGPRPATIDLCRA